VASTAITPRCRPDRDPRQQPEHERVGCRLPVARGVEPPLQPLHHEQRGDDGAAAQAGAAGERAEADGERILLARDGAQMCRARPSESSAASATASDIVG